MIVSFLGFGAMSEKNSGHYNWSAEDTINPQYFKARSVNFFIANCLS